MFSRFRLRRATPPTMLDDDETSERRVAMDHYIRTLPLEFNNRKGPTANDKNLFAEVLASREAIGQVTYAIGKVERHPAAEERRLHKGQETAAAIPGI